MPLKRPLTNPASIDTHGKLFVVATPIGNRDDITLRALNVLKEVDLVATEDTRHTGRFLSGYQIQNKLISYHEHNEIKRTPELIKKLKAGKSIALLSNAGTPTVSDPGYRLIKAAIAGEIPVVPVPGVSAVITAISVAGLSTDSFVFVGFSARKKKKRVEQLKTLAEIPHTIVFYESPRRILTLMLDIRKTMGDRYAVLGREMTKLYEEFLRGPISGIINVLEERPGIKGECTLLIAGFETGKVVSSDHIEKEIRKKLTEKNGSPASISKEIAKKYGFAKNGVYKEILRIKKEY